MTTMTMTWLEVSWVELRWVEEAFNILWMNFNFFVVVHSKASCVRSSLQIIGNSLRERFLWQEINFRGTLWWRWWTVWSHSTPMTRVQIPLKSTYSFFCKMFLDRKTNFCYAFNFCYSRIWMSVIDTVNLSASFGCFLSFQNNKTNKCVIQAM